MYKIILLLFTVSFSFAGGFKYLVYITGVEFDKQEKVFKNVSLINDSKKVGIGYSLVTDENSRAKANAQMLKNYLENYSYDIAYKMDVLNALGTTGWELIESQKSKNSEETFYFKKEK